MGSPLITLEQVKAVAAAFLHLNEVDSNMLDIAAATFVANKFDGDPLWVQLVGAPSGAKTELLASMSGHPQTYLLSSITANTLASGAVVYNRKAKTKENASLLPRLTGKLLLIKDFGSILSLRDDTCREIYAQLREIYDGSYYAEWGNGQKLSWKGKLGIVAACTPAIDQAHAVRTSLGERFLLYRVFPHERFSVAKTALGHTLGLAGQRESLRDIMVRFLCQFDGERCFSVSIPKEIEERLALLAVLISHARTGVQRDRFTQILEAAPEAEGPARLAKQFKLLATGLAIVRGKPAVDEDIYRLIAKAGRDSMPRLRLEVLTALWQLYSRNKNWSTTKQVADQANRHKSTVKYHLEDLHALRLIERDSDDEDKSTYRWAPEADLISMIEATGGLSHDG